MSSTVGDARSAQMLNASIPKLLAMFSLPAIVGMLTQAAYNIIDRIFVGHAIGQLGIAGITISFPFMLIVMAFGMLFGFGGAALISLHLGRRQHEEAERILARVTVLLLLASAVLTVVGLALLDPLLTLFGTSAEVRPYARDFLQVIIPGTVFQLVGFGFNGVIRAQGSPRVAMLTLLFGNLINVILAPILLFGFPMGMRGAALATVTAQAVSAVWTVWFFFSRHSQLRFRRDCFRLELRPCLEILAVGSPHFAMQLAAATINAVLNNRLRLYGGDAAVSIWGIIYVTALVVMLPIFGINQGAQPIIGFNYGAERYDRVKKALQTAVLAASCLALTGFFVAMTFPTEIIRLFEPNDETLATLGGRAIRLAMLMMPTIGFQIISASYFQAVGKPKQALLLTLSRQVLLLLPAAMILPRFFGLDGVWLALAVSDGLSAVVTAVCLFLELRHLQARHAGAALDEFSVPLGDR